MLAPPLPRNEKARIAALHRFEILDTPRESAFDELAWLASQICKTPVAGISLIDSESTWFKATVGFDVKEVPRFSSFCNYTICGQDPLFEVPNLIEDERFKDHPFVADKFKVRFYAAAPLTTAEGLKLGAIFVVDLIPRTLTPDQRKALDLLSRRVVAEMELRLVNQRFRKWTDQLLSGAETRLRQAKKTAARGQIADGAKGDLDEIRALIASNADLMAGISDDPKRHQQLVERAISVIQRGDKLARRLLAEAPRRKKTEEQKLVSELGHLTPRETQVLRLIAKGLSNRAMARRLGLAETTVKVYMQQIFRKTGVKNRTELALLVTRKSGIGH